MQAIPCRILTELVSLSTYIFNKPAFLDSRCNQADQIMRIISNNADLIMRIISKYCCIKG